MTHNQWCPIHENGMIRRGRHSCPRGKKRGMKCLPDFHLVTRPYPKLVPMKQKHEPTQRAVERRTKGYAR
jgi:hypothetical protein